MIFYIVNLLTRNRYNYTLTHIHVIIFNKYTYINVFVFQFFIKMSQNREDFQTHCNNRRNLFLFACRQWYLYSNLH